MKFVTTCALAVSVGAAMAAPVEKRQSADIDGVVLNYALTLEYLEAQFYKEALANYTEADFENAGFFGVRENIVQVAAHEQTHADFLAGISDQNID